MSTLSALAWLILLEAVQAMVCPCSSSPAWKLKVFLNCLKSLLAAGCPAISSPMSGTGLPPRAWHEASTHSPARTSSTAAPATSSSSLGGLGPTVSITIIR